MSGHLNGVAARLQKEEPKALCGSLVTHLIWDRPILTNKLRDSTRLINCGWRLWSTTITCVYKSVNNNVIQLEMHLHSQWKYR